MKTYGNTQTEIHEQCVGLWEGQHGNIVYIRPGAHGHFMASCALGTTGAPCVRRCFRNALTIDMPGECRPGLEAFAIEFGRPYRRPDVLLTSGIDENTHQEYLEPSSVNIVSATDAEREYMLTSQPLTICRAWLRHTGKNTFSLIISRTAR